MNRDKLLGDSKMFPLILKFSVPAIVGMLVNALYNTVDRIYIGQKIGAMGIAGISVSFPIMLIMMAFAMLIGFGSTSLMSIRLGEKKRDDVRIITGNTFVLLLSGALILSTLGLIFLKPVLIIFGASAEVLPYSLSYLQIIMVGMVFQSLGFGLNNHLRALGSPKIAMLTMIVGGLMNVILDPIFIFVFNWGMRGAALATIISQFASMIWVLCFIFRKKNDLRPLLHDFILKARIVKKILAMGTPPFLMQLSSSGLMIVLNNSLYFYGGDIAISAVGIAISINNLIMMPVYGLNQGVQPIVGYNYGAGNYDRVRSAIKTAVLIATVFVLVGFCVTTFFPKYLILLFNSSDTILIDLGTRAVRTFLIMLPVVGFQVIVSGFFQATGKPRQAATLTLTRQLVILIPLIIILPKFFGLNGILYAAPVSDFLAAILAAILFTHELRKMDKDHKPLPESFDAIKGMSETEAENMLALDESSVNDVPPII